MDNETLTLHFGGEEGIDIDTLTRQLVSLKTTLLTLRDLKGSEKEKISIRVKPFSEGSFILQILIEYIANNVPLIANTFGIAKTYLEIVKLKKELEGQPPKEVVKQAGTSQYRITVNNGNVFFVPLEVVETLTSKKKVDDDLSSQFKTLDKDLARGDLEIKVERNGKTAVETFAKKELANLSKKTSIDKFVNPSIETINTVWLTIVDVNFLGEAKGTFSLAGKPIPCEIEDRYYLRKIADSEIAFSAGTRVYAELKIIETQNAVSEKKDYRYLIIKVLDIKNGSDFEQLNCLPENEEK